MARGKPIHVQGLSQLRRDLRKVDKEAVKEIRIVIRDAARIVASEAGVLAPRRTGTLSASYRGTTSGTKGIVRSRLPYARFIEYGFHPGGGSTFVEGAQPIGRALERREDEVVRALGDGIDRASKRSGWH